MRFLICPKCSQEFELSEDDPDCTLSELHHHLVWSHDLDRRSARMALALAYILNETEIEK
jgi:hypothetical protein